MSSDLVLQNCRGILQNCSVHKCPDPGPVGVGKHVRLLPGQQSKSLKHGGAGIPLHVPGLATFFTITAPKVFHLV